MPVAYLLDSLSAAPCDPLKFWFQFRRAWVSATSAVHSIGEVTASREDTDIERLAQDGFARYAEAMKRMALSIIVPFFLAVVSGSAQKGPALISTAYSFPLPTVAPGQIARLRITGFKAIPQGTVKATAVPLPTTLAGISVTVRSYYRHYLADPWTLQGEYKAPILSIEQRPLCFDAVVDDNCFLTTLTVQIPFEIDWPSPGIYFRNDLIINENGVDSRVFQLTVGADQIHIVTDTDRLNSNGSVVGQVVTHADGTLVSYQSPPKPGEVIVIYAWGLGNTSPQVPDGDLTPNSAAIVALEGRTGVYVRLDFRQNASPAPLYETPQAIAPAFLTPGQVGLYQVHVQMPSTFPPLAPCNFNAGLGPVSNLTITLFSSWSSDGVALCIPTLQ